MVQHRNQDHCGTLLGSMERGGGTEDDEEEKLSYPNEH